MTEETKQNLVRYINDGKTDDVKICTKAYCDGIEMGYHLGVRDAYEKYMRNGCFAIVAAGATAILWHIFKAH